MKKAWNAGKEQRKLFWWELSVIWRNDIMISSFTGRISKSGKAEAK